MRDFLGAATVSRMADFLSLGPRFAEISRRFFENYHFRENDGGDRFDVTGTWGCQSTERCLRTREVRCPLARAVQHQAFLPALSAAV